MKIILIGFAVLMLAACAKDPISRAPSSNPNLTVALLFEYEGCKVYRFYDNRYVYYTNCQGETAWSETHHCGKGCVRTEDHSVKTSK